MDKLKKAFLRSRLICWLWAKIYHRWLDEDDTVLRVCSWRSAMIQTKYRSRRWMSPCFWWFK